MNDRKAAETGRERTLVAYGVVNNAMRAAGAKVRQLTVA